MRVRLRLRLRLWVRVRVRVRVRVSVTGGSSEAMISYEAACAPPSMPR